MADLTESDVQALAERSFVVEFDYDVTVTHLDDGARMGIGDSADALQSLARELLTLRATCRHAARRERRLTTMLTEVVALCPAQYILDALEPANGNKTLRRYALEPSPTQEQIERWRAALAEEGQDV